MSSKYDIAANAGTHQFSWEEDAWREQSRLQAAVLEAYEACSKHEPPTEPDCMYCPEFDEWSAAEVQWQNEHDILTEALDAAWEALQQFNGETR